MDVFLKDGFIKDGFLKDGFLSHEFFAGDLMESYEGFETDEQITENHATNDNQTFTWKIIFCLYVV